LSYSDFFSLGFFGAVESRPSGPNVSCSAESCFAFFPIVSSLRISLAQHANKSQIGQMGSGEMFAPT
jgi:hypothetical protein